QVPETVLPPTRAGASRQPQKAKSSHTRGFLATPPPRRSNLRSDKKFPPGQRGMDANRIGRSKNPAGSS
ncbi:MAG: hypothetical protein QF752_07245, partial [Planctomycetota bacterium]|nr:hypothetical protein [Planctomycetota bacterium]